MSVQIECVLLVLLLFLHWIDHESLLRAIIKSRAPGISPSYYKLMCPPATFIGK